MNFPNELLDYTFQFSDNVDLLSLAVVNKLFSAIALPILYRSVTLDLRRRRLDLCLETLLSNDRLVGHVHHLLVDWRRTSVSEQDSILLEDRGADLIACLYRLRNLSHLSLHLCIFDNIKSLLAPFPFKLTKFSTTLECDESLVQFLEMQPSLHDFGLYSSTETPSVLEFRACPALRVFRWGPEVHLEMVASTLRETMSSLQEVDVVFNMQKTVEDTLGVLGQLSFSGRASFTFNTYASLARISAELPSLKHLCLGGSNIDASCATNELTERVTLSLPNFRRLETLTLNVAQHVWDDCQLDLSGVISGWSTACHSLRLVIFKCGVKSAAIACQ